MFRVDRIMLLFFLLCFFLEELGLLYFLSFFGFGEVFRELLEDNCFVFFLLSSSLKNFFIKLFKREILGGWFFNMFLFCYCFLVFFDWLVLIESIFV